MSNSIPAEEKAISISVLIVTYGNRWHFLKQVLESVCNEPIINGIILVNNAVDYDLSQKLKESRLCSNLAIETINLPTNQGSAGGIKIGLELALTLNIDFLYILDDDNIITPSTVGNLLNAYYNLESKLLPLALFSYREGSSPFFRDIARGINPKYLYNKKNNFAGFSLQHLLSNKYRKWFLDPKLGSSLIPIVKIPIAPWSGLLFPITTIQKMGLPMEEYYLYADDTEYTYRITKTGGSIWMVTDSIVKDLEISWGFQQRKNKFIHIPILENTGFRVYYTIRNLVHFSKHNLVNNQFLFLLNGVLFTCYLFSAALFLRKLGAFVIYWKAIQDGLKGNLGPRFDVK
ncbi:MAG: glycosyltransferase [Haliscomenobacter sp.]|uniref:glycosyltransferase n=1 Tax=Haliscomenobacter sp. TaxID=2717303 RepID=UPI0029A7C105|nr:glycosyltransferase [Haliscomenobacter sp.]MDX2069004.1 glycosyltransferase [Haliscomenobacter sp.]